MGFETRHEAIGAARADMQGSGIRIHQGREVKIANFTLSNYRIQRLDDPSLCQYDIIYSHDSP